MTNVAETIVTNGTAYLFERLRLVSKTAVIMESICLSALTQNVKYTCIYV